MISHLWCQIELVVCPELEECDFPHGLFALASCGRSWSGKDDWGWLDQWCDTGPPQSVAVPPWNPLYRSASPR